MKEVQTLAENLGLVIDLDPQALARMERTQPILKLAQFLIVHGASPGG
jgi:hypothetical protein